MTQDLSKAIEIDEEADAAYVRISDAAIARTREVADGLIVDFDRDDHVVGVEVLGLRQRIGPSDPRSYLHGLVTGLELRAAQPVPG